MTNETFFVNQNIEQKTESYIFNIHTDCVTNYQQATMTTKTKFCRQKFKKKHKDFLTLTIINTTTTITTNGDCSDRQI